MPLIHDLLFIVIMSDICLRSRWRLTVQKLDRKSGLCGHLSHQRRARGLGNRHSRIAYYSWEHRCLRCHQLPDHSGPNVNVFDLSQLHVLEKMLWRLTSIRLVTRPRWFPIERLRDGLLRVPHHLLALAYCCPSGPSKFQLGFRDVRRHYGYCHNILLRPGEKSIHRPGSERSAPRRMSSLRQVTGGPMHPCRSVMYSELIEIEMGVFGTALLYDFRLTLN